MSKTLTEIAQIVVDIGWELYGKADERSAMQQRIRELEAALRDLLRYARACEGLLNASEALQCKDAARLLEGKA